METVFVKELKKLKNGNALVAIYDDKEDLTSFYVGYIVKIFSDSILIISLNEFQQKDGCVLVRLEDIFKIERDTIYLNKISNLLGTGGNKLDQKIISNDDISKYGIDEIIKKCKDENKIISIKLIYQDYITGLIEKYDDDCIVLKAYKDNGLYDGITIIKYEDIQNLAFDRTEELTVKSLIRNR